MLILSGKLWVRNGGWGAGGGGGGGRGVRWYVPLSQLIRKPKLGM